MIQQFSFADIIFGRSYLDFRSSVTRNFTIDLKLNDSMRYTTNSTGLRKSVDQTVRKVCPDFTFKEWMRSDIGSTSAIFFVSTALLAMPFQLPSQESGSSRRVTAAAELPETPQPQFALATNAPTDPQDQSIQQPGQSTNAQDSSSSQSLPQQPDAKKRQYEKAEEQIKEEEKQRVAGVVPAFNVTYHSDAVSMTSGQKMRLSFRSAIDPVTFIGGLMGAGFKEAKDEDTGFGWGPEGFGKRAGAAYLDAFDGTMIGNGILPSILHQDPRFFRMGHGSFKRRLLYSAATSFICKHDNTGKWEPNYSNVAGNIVSGAISNLYYPASNSGIGQTFGNGMLVTAEGTIAAVFDEFWPDVSRKFLHRDPTHGIDAQLRAQDEAEKQAKQNQK